MESIRVLYVEDDPSDRELTRHYLQRHAPHLKLKLVETVVEALDQLACGDLDLILSDYRLPDGTGLDLLEAIKAREFRVPVVLVTGLGDVQSAVRLLKAGAADYVVKRPGYLETLPPVVEGAFRWFRSTTELRQTTVRVLYAEHDPADVELTRRAFIEHGPHLHLDVVSRGREALERLRAVPYDLFLLDHRMPDVSGIEVLKALRDERITVPAVMVTGQADEQTAVQAFKLGAADYVIKREGYLTKLPSTLENVLAQRRLADEKDALLVLSGLTGSISTLQDLSELVQGVTKAAMQLFKADMGILWLVGGTELHPVGWAGIEESALRALRFRLEERFRERAAAERRVPIADLLAGTRSPHPIAAVVEHPGRILAVSLVSAGRLGGLLAVASHRPREFSAMEERLLTILADHASIALENVRLYQQLKDRFEELQRTQSRLLQTEKIAVMGQLLAGVAHELNNPLSVVTGQTALLRQMVGGGPLAERAEKISKAAERCARIVRNFLTLARQRPPEHEQVRLNQVVREAVELLAYPLRVDDVQVTLDLVDDLPVLWADPNQLHQVVVNLVTNAHHAMRETQPPRRLTFTTQYDLAQERLSLTVADTGPGVPPEIQGRIFEPFFTTKATEQGTGLGLSLCHGIIEAHGGTIRVDSRPGQGAVFRVELPLGELPGTTPQVGVADPTSLVRGRAVLVVDDEPDVAEVLADMLSADGHQVETASNGTSALDKLRQRTYDLILCDIKMPGLDGPGLYREVERRHPGLHQRFIFLTGDTLSPDTRAFLGRIGPSCLSKPFAPAEVQRLTQQVLKNQ